MASGQRSPMAVMWLEGLAERACPPAPVPRPPQPMSPNLTTSLPAARTPWGTMSCEAAAAAVAAAGGFRKLRRDGVLAGVAAFDCCGVMRSPEKGMGFVPECAGNFN